MQRQSEVGENLGKAKQYSMADKNGWQKCVCFNKIIWFIVIKMIMKNWSHK